MALLSRTLTMLAALALASLAACASEDVAPGGLDGPATQPPPAAAMIYQPAPVVGPAAWTAPPPFEGLLAAPPSNAQPGECFAKVIVPGQPIAQPPPVPRAVWVLSPPGPGQLVPNWCLYYEPGAPRPVILGPERLGWIRVICERDATPETIRHLQRRLNAHGYYQGAYNGRYDAETARGVARFQQERHIRHGGYLSVQTVEALNAGPPIGAPPAVLVSLCGLAACVPAAPLGLNGPYGPYATPPYRSLLNWPGKSIY